MPLEGGRLWQTSEIYSIFWTDSSKFQSIVCFGHVLLLSSGKLTRISMTNIWKIIVYNCLTSLNQNLEFTKIHKKFARSFLTEQNVFHFLSKLNVDNMYSSWVKYFWPRWPPPHRMAAAKGWGKKRNIIWAPPPFHGWTPSLMELRRGSWPLIGASRNGAPILRYTVLLY